MMDRIYVLQCEDSLEGIFTGVYEAYRRKLPPEDTVLVAGEENEYRLFAQYDTIPTDVTKAYKVIKTLRERFGEAVYEELCYAMASVDPQKAEAVYRTIATGLSMQNPRLVMGNLANAYIHHVFELSRNVKNEIHKLKEFLRFQELDHHVLSAVVGPKNHIIMFIAPHFADRLPLENFAIYDDGRDCMIIHPAGQDWYLCNDVGHPVRPEWSTQEKEYQELFQYFCHKIAIKERKNIKLQQQFLPLRFQKYMVEFGQKFQNDKSML